MVAWWRGAVVKKRLDDCRPEHGFYSLSAVELRRRFAVTNAVPGFVAPAIVEAGAEGLGPPTPAAVLVPIVNRTSGLTLLLTLRTPHLRDHAGQVSFPGGRHEAGDADPVATALREAEEEVGLDRRRIEILGLLPEYLTSTGFAVTPVVGLVEPPLNLRLDDFEVAEAFEPPLSFFLDPANHRRDTVVWQGAPREFWAMPWQDRYIWGATAGMLVSLHKVLTGAP